jgi:ArsR family metal-binding transcriptional regulator
MAATADNKIPPVLNNDYKKILQAKYTLGQEDEFYIVTKTNKGRFVYELKEGITKALNPRKKKSSINIEDKVSSEYLINKLIDIEKRLAFNENKQHKNKKKINKIVSDIYEENEVEINNVNDETKSIENKLKDIVNDDTDINDNNSDNNTKVNDNN